MERISDEFRNVNEPMFPEGEGYTVGEAIGRGENGSLAACSAAPTATSPRHIAAHDYASRGIPVFPCIPNAKQPATLHGFKDASTHPREIDAWFTDDPNRNLAFCPDD